MKISFHIIGFKDEFRGADLFAQLAKFGYPVERIDSVDLRVHQASNLKHDSELAMKWNGRLLAPAELGCLSSHRVAWKFALDSGADFAFFFEDDAVLKNEAFANYLRILVNNPHNVKRPEIVSLYWPYALKNNLAQYLERRKLNLFGLVKVFHPTYGTVGYMVNRAGLEILSSKPDLESTTADWPIEVFTMDFYVTRENLVIHPNNNSTIQSTRELVQTALKQSSDNSILVLENTYRFMNVLLDSLALRKILKEKGYPKAHLLTLKRFTYNLYYFGYLKIPLIKVVAGCEVPKKQKHFFSLFKIASLFPYYQAKAILSKIGRRAIYDFAQTSIRFKIRKFVPQKYKFLYKDFTSKINYLDPIKFHFISSRRLNHTDSEVIKDKTNLDSHNITRTTEKFACVLTVFNQDPQLIDRALGSILNQTEAFSEVIIVNDGSTRQDTNDFLKQFVNNPNVKVYQQSNSGVCKARNFGLSVADSYWVVFFDPDDIMSLDFCDEARKLLAVAPTLDIICGTVRVIRDETVHDWVPGPFDPKFFAYANRIPMGSLVRKDFFEQIGGYRESFNVLGSEDWDLWSRAVAYGARIGRINGYSYDYYVDTNGTSRSSLTDRNHVVQRKIIRSTYDEILQEIRVYYDAVNHQRK